MTNIKEQLGKRIREIRKNRNYTQEKLSELADMEIPTLSNIENGKNYPNYETLAKLSKALGVRPYELYMFDYYISKEDMIKEISSHMQNDETLATQLYKFYTCIK